MWGFTRCILLTRQMRGTLPRRPGNANLPIGDLLRDANQEIGVPGERIPLVPKMPHAAEHHRDAQLVRGHDDVPIAN
jgi:hypothetical protein